MRKHLKKYLPNHDAVHGNRWLRPFRNSLLHPRLWHLNRHSAAGAVAAGMFCGLIPGPLQMIGAAICALVFRVNLPLALLTTLYTNPFTIVPLYVLAYQIGRIATGDPGGFVDPPALRHHPLRCLDRSHADLDARRRQAARASASCCLRSCWPLAATC